MSLAIKLGNSALLNDDYEAADIVNKFYFMQFMGSGHKWQDLDDMPYLDMQLAIACINAYGEAQRMAGEKGRIYSQLGIQKAGAHL